MDLVWEVLQSFQVLTELLAVPSFRVTEVEANKRVHLTNSCFRSHFPFSITFSTPDLIHFKTNNIKVISVENFWVENFCRKKFGWKKLEWNNVKKTNFKSGINEMRKYVLKLISTENA